jgi:hypothetical protein
MEAAEKAGWSNKAHIGAFKKGYAAAKAGKAITDCPYRRHPGGGVMNGSIAFPRAWREGFRTYQGDAA